MMKTIHVVLGANYGDEGKGRTTAYIAAKHHDKNRAVVRFNGGAQAGHTVGSGKDRHVFSHFGSGSFDYVPTIFTADFVCSPYLFKKENEQLIRKSVIRPDLYVSPQCLVTTPWDMWLNQLQECKRGDRRHGSVGVGFGETIERSTKYEEFRLTVADLISPFDRMDKLVKLVSEYLPRRLADLNINPHELDEHLGWMYRNPDQIIDIFNEECDYFLKRIFVLDEDEALKKFDTLIFEGAQGLALDQEAPDFPHVTRSYTGIDNVLRVLDFAGIDDPIHLTYVTRPYLTRHGAGPLKREVDAEGFKRLFEVVDETNKPHEYQGSLRFAILDMDDAINRIVKDQFKIPRHRIGNITLMTTCLDQAVSEDGFPAVLDGKSYMFSNQVFGAEFGSRINAQKVILCQGEEDWMVDEFKFLGSNRLEVVFGDEE